MARLEQPDCCTQHTASYSQENIQPFSLPLLHLFFHRVTFQNSQRGIVNIITPPIFCSTAALSTSPAVACRANARMGVQAKASFCGQVARVGRGCVRLFLGSPASAIKFPILAKEFSRKPGLVYKGSTYRTDSPC